MFHKRYSVINSIYSGQQVFSYSHLNLFLSWQNFSERMNIVQALLEIVIVIRSKSHKTFFSLLVEHFSLQSLLHFMG